MNSPRISVIMSAYNCQDLVREAIESILNQTFTDFEFLIADDGSTDNTRNIIDSYSDERIKIFHNSENKHVCWTWNKLLKNANAPYVTFQDADDISYPKRLEILFETAKINPEYAIIGSNHLRPFQKWRSFRTSNFLKTHNEIFEKVKKHGVLDSCGPRSLFKKSVIEERGGFREIFPKAGWEDFDLILRIIPEQKIMNISDVLYEYKYYPKSYSRLFSDNFNFEKMYIHEIGLFLFKERLENKGIDSLIKNDDKNLKCFINNLRNLYEKDKTVILRKISKNQASNKDFKNAFKMVLKAIKNDYLNLDNYLCLFLITKSLIYSVLFFFTFSAGYPKKIKFYRSLE